MSIADRLQFFSSLNGASQQNLSQNATTSPPSAQGSQPALNTTNLQPRTLHSGGSSPTRQEFGNPAAASRSNPQLSKAGSRSLGNLTGGGGVGGSYSLLSSNRGSHNYLSGGRVNSQSQSSLLQQQDQQGDAPKFLSVKERIARYGSNGKELDSPVDIKPRHAAAAITVTPASVLDQPHDDHGDGDRRESVSGPAESDYHRRHSHNTRATPYSLQPTSGKSSRHASHQDLHPQQQQKQKQGSQSMVGADKMEVDEGLGQVRRASAMDFDMPATQPQPQEKGNGEVQLQEGEMQLDEPAAQMPFEEEKKPLLQEQKQESQEQSQPQHPIVQRDPTVAPSPSPATTTAAPPIKPSTTQSSAAARPGSGTGSPSSSKFATVTPKCQTCAKPVYLMEQLVVDNNIFHKTCLKCNHCKATLKMGNLASMNGEYYCKPHFKQLFKLKGNYDEGFGKELHKKQWLQGGPNAAAGTGEQHQ